MSFSDASTHASPEYEECGHDKKELGVSAQETSICEKREELSSLEASPMPSPTIPPAPEDVPPDGGWMAWLQVAAAYFLFLNPWGMVNGYGAFQDYYDTTLGRSQSDISWIGTLQGFLLLLVGGLTGPLYDKGYMHELIWTGSFLMVFGMMMTSISTQYWQIFLAQGVATGLGGGMLFVPSVSVLVQWFSRRRSVAVGICATGGSVGAVIIPIIFRRLQPRIGFGWATRVIAFIQLGTLAFSLATVRRRIRPSKESAAARALIDPAALRSPHFWALTAGIFFSFMGIYLPFFYMGAWSLQSVPAVQADPDLAFYLLSVLNGGSLLGRLLPGLAAIRLGALNLMLAFSLATLILSFAWLALGSGLPATLAFCSLYGFFSGATISLPATVIAAITPDLRRTGTWMGMVFAIASLGLLVGSPIAGAIIQAQGGRYEAMQIFGGVVVACAAGSLAFLRFMLFREGKGWSVPV